MFESHGVYAHGDLEIVDNVGNYHFGVGHESKMRICGGLPDGRKELVKFRCCEKEVVRPPVTRSATLPAPYVSGDYGAYNCPVTGREIDGRLAHRENLERTGCRLLETGEREHNEKSRKRKAAEHMRKSVEESVTEVLKHV